MIRINLLPDTVRATSGAGSGVVWGLGYLVVTFLWSVGLGVIYYTYSDKLTEQMAANASLERQIEQARKQSEGLEAVRAKLDKSRQLETVVGELQKARMGPTRVLMELSKILSVARGPTVDEERLVELRKSNPLSGYNPGWDVRRLWLQSFEEDQRECAIQGYGKSNEDVAEFLRRLALSEVFDEVMLEKTSSVKTKGSGLEVIDFRLTCKVNY
ncbi:MAG: PilN domain-containing protein [Proteobacteria bacterium]|nr:PilN domain-containing protein [Pseudomonadota bacterium]